MFKKTIKSLLPNAILDKIITFRNNYLDGLSLQSYSQEGEDMILRRLFEHEHSGFYVDVGAHHPKRFSNTYFFYQKGWNGINIDAMPGSMKLFNKIRPRDINIEKPIADTKEVLTYYAFDESALNGFSKELSERRANNGSDSILFTKEIETTTLENILDENLPRNKTIDFLSIDVEGLDFKVLKSMNFEKHQPTVILIEILGSNLQDINNSEIALYLKNKGYEAYAKTINTVFFIKNEFR